MIKIVINLFVLIVNFRNHFDKALTEIFQFRRALKSNDRSRFLQSGIIIFRSLIGTLKNHETRVVLSVETLTGVCLA